MLTSIELAHQIFEELSASIDQACRERYWFTACRPARVLGFTQSDVSTVFAHAQRFDLEIEPDIYLSLTYRSFEPSGSFLTLPGVSKFELTLTHQGQLVKSYANEFEEMPVPAMQTPAVGGYSLGI